MHTRTVQRGLVTSSALVGLVLVFIGARFLLTPEAAERGFGVRFNEGGNYAFHFIKGIRDLFTGVLIVVLAVRRQRQALALVLGWGAVVPLADMLIVLTNPQAIRSAAWIHGVTIVILLVLAALLVASERARSRTPLGTRGPQP